MKENTIMRDCNKTGKPFASSSGCYLPSVIKLAKGHDSPREAWTRAKGLMVEYLRYIIVCEAGCGEWFISPFAVYRVEHDDWNGGIKITRYARSDGKKVTKARTIKVDFEYILTDDEYLKKKWVKVPRIDTSTGLPDKYYVETIPEVKYWLNTK